MADPVAPAPSPAPTDTSAPAPSPTPVAAAPAADPAKPAVVADPAKPAAPVVDPAKPIIPEKYDFANVELPQGIALDRALIDVVTPLFKEAGVTQEVASKFVAAHVKHIAETEAKRDADFKDWMKTTVTDYQASLKKEWGAAHDANLTVAQRGMARVVSPGMKALLDETGLGSHPEFVKAFFQVGKMVTEDTPPNGSVPTGQRKATANVLYDAPPTNQ